MKIHFHRNQSKTVANKTNHPTKKARLVGALAPGKKHIDNVEKWCLERREEVLEYLSKEGVIHGQVSEWPAWDVYPHTSSWAIESHKSPGWVGWWVICGDHPTDYVSAEKIKEPRYAYKTIAESWLEICQSAEEGKEHPSMHLSLPSTELIEMLRSRAKMFLEWVADEENWQYENC